MNYKSSIQAGIEPPLYSKKILKRAMNHILFKKETNFLLIPIIYLFLVSCGGTKSRTERRELAKVYLDSSDQFLDENKYEKALVYLNKASSFDTSLVEIYHLKGYTNLKLRKYQAAINDLTKAIETKRSKEYSYLWEVYHTRALAFQLNEQHKEALIDFNHILTEDSTSTRFLFDRSSSLIMLGDTMKACEDWRKMIELGDHRGVSLINEHCK
ncbi:MAG: tetratricopeptide repeat protein [Thermonemataceae bacterium]